MARGDRGSWVVHLDAGALELQLSGDPQRGGVTDVVAVGLERRAPDADPGAGEVAAPDGRRDVDDALGLALVDVVHVAQERHRILDTELAGAVHERADVLGQTAATETD